MPALRNAPMVECLEDTPKGDRPQQVERWIFELQMLRNQGHECAKWALETLKAYDNGATTGNILATLESVAAGKPKGE